MIYEPSLMAVLIFGAIVAVTLGLSFWLGAKAKSAKGYFAAGGGIHWFVNGVAFAGDYLSAASFLGICGMIAFYGYDGFLYSIGYLAGWIVALFVIAEPLKRMGRFTFADALDSKFQSRGIKLAAAISTLAVSIFYLIPQMVGAGALITPLLGFPHYVGVLMVGTIVILIVVTAGMVSTTYVQFLKGSLLVIFSTILTVLILQRGLSTEPVNDGKSTHQFQILGPVAKNDLQQWRSELKLTDQDKLTSLDQGAWAKKGFLQLTQEGKNSYWKISENEEQQYFLSETQYKLTTSQGAVIINGLPQGTGEGETDFYPVGRISKLPGDKTETGPLGLTGFLSTIRESEIILWGSESIKEEDGSALTIYFPKPTSGEKVLSPGNHPKFAGIRGDKFYEKLNFLSLMLALFCGTASLPHILIRYYTVKDQASARKSTIVGIGSIGYFYILTLFMGLGAMTSGAMDVTNSNMAAPLLAKSIGDWLFAIISAIAFTTVLGTVSGLIIASSGAVVHDLMSSFLKIEMNDFAKVRIAKIASVVVGVIAIILGILFEKFNVNYLVGWAFSVAASANLPALVMLLFWPKTTKQGITVAIFTGMITSLGWILLSADSYKGIYGWDPETAIVPFSQPGLVTIPLGFIVLIVVSLLTQPKTEESVN
ncbi:MAG: cation acetate symporter [Gimesia sp.]|jgi:cation/acetate symporter|uniref:Cation acetate symporter n=1 Tax=Gimesia maris TaxID=122 RepID=A0A3D3R2I2_9PLAN|nr:cation acetate symporter [Gimesia sp.]HCO22292.1 cation acetate symporter [Gimesia maris]|tara:strand:+ start:12450 stop:14405 length:1956 start_codon:yes stop_codon:yes gene_type:complete